MPITIDLGGAPANEDCAQLGHTPDFAAVNRLEVDAYRAALIALFGTPPEGCTLTAQPNHHDFGTYTTLALVIGDDADLGPARAYAEAVEDGIGSWLEAGMAPPVTYDDAEAVCHKASIADVVLGALQTTRPDARGNFPLPAFAIIHRNLSAAYPDEAVRFAALMGEPA
ncbi:hypothetical protein [Blastomonas sp. CCH9-A1]|jgi:hypothetical protein|uniref:hypothetical protein n=1 Tax=Blastomonas sp. CCH9-A1 TaxID=1768738 RepID=UPI000826D2FA|nr:hypothetical protein [Blastomonas sp. CCH9-A1]